MAGVRAASRHIGRYRGGVTDRARRSGSARMIAWRSGSSIEPHRAISSSVRPHPEQRPDAVLITQTFMQGVEIK